MIGRGTIQIPLNHIVDISEDLKRDVLEIVVEGEAYPGWNPGTDPMIFLGSFDLIDAEFIRALVHHSTYGSWPKEATEDQP